MHLVGKIQSLFRLFVKGINSKGDCNNEKYITARGDKSTNYAHTQCMFQGAARTQACRRKEKRKEKRRESARTTVESATGVCPCVGVRVGCVGRGGSASAGA